MATGNTAAQDARANDFATDFATATLVIKAGATTLATHTLAGFGAPTNGVIAANTIADATNVAPGTADTATLTAGTSVYTLTVGGVASGADVEVSDTSYINGGTSEITSFSVTFPA